MAKRRHMRWWRLGPALLLAACVLQAQDQRVLEQRAPPNPIGPSSNSSRARQILDQTLQALGGAAFLNVRSMSSRGRYFSIYEGATAGVVPYESYDLYPDKRRFSYGKDQAVILVNDGERGWQLDRFGMTRQDPEAIRRWRLAARYGLYNLLQRVIQEPNVLILEAGTDFVDNATVDVVEIIDARRTHVKLYVHKTSRLPVRIVYRLQNPKTQEWEDYADTFGDYQNKQGVLTPVHVTRFVNQERVAEIFRFEVKYNEALPPHVFAPLR